jgi:hypothetical protein
MQSYSISYIVRELNIELTTNPTEYGYFCDPGLDIEKGINNYIPNYKSKYKCNIKPGYSYNNPDNTIHENETDHLDTEDDTKYTKYNKNNASKVICVDNMIYGVIIVGTVTITTYLVNNGII